MAYAYDFVVIGSGFGGSVSAMRLSQKGYRVAVLEMGKWLNPSNFPKTNWQARKFLWAPKIRAYGLQKITTLKGLMLLHGVGVGGGSLVYANSLLTPEPSVFRDPCWPSGLDWHQELAPSYDLCRKMLGVVENPVLEDADDALRGVARTMGVETSFRPNPVAVFFGEPNKTVKDPFFGGDGPDRTGCDRCGGCMIGCHNTAKNTLDHNYLFFAQKWGTHVFAETRATQITPKPTGGYVVHTQHSTRWFNNTGPCFEARHVILSAGVLGTVELLLKSRDQSRTLPRISRQLGRQVRTNGESLVGATTFDKKRDLSKGIAIGASIKPDDQTTIEAVRYPSGSSLMRFLAVPLTPNGSWMTRPLKLLWVLCCRFFRMVRLLTILDWAKYTIVLLVMQRSDTRFRLTLERSMFSGFKKRLHGRATKEPIPSFLPVAQKAVRILATHIHGEPQNVVSEVLCKTPATAHILGGACMGHTPETGVVDTRHEVFGYPGLYVCDGSVVPANLGVNPSLTIAAIAERFAAQFPTNPNVAPGFQPHEIKLDPDCM